MKGDAASLPVVDAYLWHRRFAEYPREKLEQHLIPAVGAYLGKALVYGLGGRWVPRKKLEEAQIVVGERAWLPFLRARRLLETVDSIFTHSMTQLYAVAERTAKGGV